MAHSRLTKLGVAFCFSLVAAGLAGGAYRYRDYLFAWDFARVHGKFEPDVPAELLAAARDYAEARNPGKACVVSPLGRDDRFVFVQLGCGSFLGERTDSEPPLAARLRYAGTSVAGLERMDPGAPENSLRRLLPREAFVRLRQGGIAGSEYVAAGQARAKARNVPASSR